MIERQRRGLTKTDYGEEEEALAARPEESEVAALNKPHYLQEQLAKLDLDSGRLGGTSAVVSRSAIWSLLATPVRDAAAAAALRDSIEQWPIREGRRTDRGLDIWRPVWKWIARPPQSPP